MCATCGCSGDHQHAGKLRFRPAAHEHDHTHDHEGEQRRTIAFEEAVLARNDHLAQHKLGVADDRDLGCDVGPDPERIGIDLNVRGSRRPGRRLTEVLAAPEPEPETRYHVRPLSKGFLPGASHCERMRFICYYLLEGEQELIEMLPQAEEPEHVFIAD